MHDAFHTSCVSTEIKNKYFSIIIIIEQISNEMKLAKQSIYHKEIRNTKRYKRDEDIFSVLDGGGGGWSQWIKRVFFYRQVAGPTDFLKLEFFNIYFLFLKEP
jgi:hypothetical protein